jgi:hypothetical protein
MAYNTFSFVGKIRKLKNNGYEEREFSGGLIKKTIRFQMVCGDSTQFMDVSALVWKDDRKNLIRTYKNVDGGKPEKLDVKWADRFNPDIINSVVGYRRFVIDTDTFAHRKELEESGLTVEFEASQKKRKEFLHAADFEDYLCKVLNNEKSKDMVFKATGNIEFSYSEKKNQFYRNFVPQKIYRVEDNAEQMCSGSMKLYFTDGAVDDSMAEDAGKILFSAYAQYYDTNIKANAFTPMALVIGSDAPKAKGFKRLFGKAEDGEVKELGVTVNFINGAQRVAITMDMLSDEQKELIELGMTTLEAIREELGGNVYGDRVTETRLVGLMKGYSSGVKDTVYNSDELTKKPVKVLEDEVPFDDDDI